MSNIDQFEDQFDRIVRYYTGEDQGGELPADLQRELERWRFVRVLYNSWPAATTVQLVNTLRREYGISEATAYRDIRSARKLFSHLEKSNREFERILVIENIKRLRDKAIKKGDLRTAASCDTNLIKIGGYDKELEPPRPIVNIHNEITYNPASVGAEEIPDLELKVEKLKRSIKRRNDDFDQAEEV